MILSCNSCGKKFVVPDQAITSSGRLVQCGSCGNKWKQFPLSKENKSSIKKSKNIKSISITKIPKPKKKKFKKKREVGLYSPEYLAKKHGINLNEVKDNPISKKRVSYGFYGSFLIFIILIIAFSRILYFSQDFIIQQIPISEFYLQYFFESIKNLFEIWKDLISSY